jgi:glutaredoxin
MALSEVLKPGTLIRLCLTLSLLWAVRLQADPGILMEVYVREDCPHCADAKAFLPTFAARHPGLTIVYRPVDREPAARRALADLARGAEIWPPGVPTFVVGDALHVGFAGPDEAERILSALITQGRPHALETQVHTELFGSLSVEQLGLPLFTLALGLLDGFNPCAMWVLLFLLSMLIHLKDRVRITWIAGTFVLVSAAVYYAFMAAWLNLFLAIGLSGPVRVALAAVALLIGAVNVKDFIALGKGISFSIPESAKPGLYARVRRVIQSPSLPLALVAVSLLAVVVNFIEALCTAGIPAIYTAVLTQQDLSASAHYAYLGLYILGYMADDSLMVATAVVALNSRKLTEKGGRLLKLLSGLVMLALGLIMLTRPEWLV